MSDHQTPSTDAGLNDACLVIRYEDPCAQAHDMLARLYAHCRLAIDAAALDEAASRLRLPRYYEPAFSDSERATIHAITGPVAARYGYA